MTDRERCFELVKRLAGLGMFTTGKAENGSYVIVIPEQSFDRLDTLIAHAELKPVPKHALANPDITSGTKVLLWFQGATEPIPTVFRGQEGATVYFDFGPADLHDIERLEANAFSLLCEEDPEREGYCAYHHTYHEGEK